MHQSGSYILKLDLQCSNLIPNVLKVHTIEENGVLSNILEFPYTGSGCVLHDAIASNQIPCISNIFQRRERDCLKELMVDILQTKKKSFLVVRKRQ